MAVMTMKMSLSPEPRPCIINGSKKAMFHTWEQIYQTIEPSILKGGHPGGQIGFVMGLCELENGKIKRIQPEQIRFMDSKHDEYDFSSMEEK